MINKHLPGLNGIRAIACLMVFYGHFNGIIAPAYSIAHSGPDIASLGVTCFFTLSGFLITTLLLQEKTVTGGISIRNFYMRRILRIWPLYFFIILLGVTSFSYYHLPAEKSTYFLFYIFFAGNLAYTLNTCIWIINPLWSVAVEEQFYLFWPFLVKTAKVGKSILLFIAAFLVLKVVARSASTGLLYFLNFTRIDCMGIGGLLAWLNYIKFAPLRLLYTKGCQLFCWAVFAYCIVRPFHLISLFDEEIYSLVAGVIILNVSHNPRTLFTLENGVLNHIGKISYGMYAYNVPLLYAWSYLLPAEKARTIPLLADSLWIILLGLNLLVAHLSYYGFERKFLLLKARFEETPVPSLA